MSPHEDPDALQLLAAAPAALVRLSGDGCVRWFNPAAARLLGETALRLGDALAPALDLAALPDDEAPIWAAAPARWLRLRRRRLGDGCELISVDDVSDLVQARSHAEHLAEVLQVAREFGRLGVWERDIRSHRGHWDAQVFAYWGLPPGSEAPTYDEATAAIVDEDRQAAIDQCWASTTQAGAYSQHYRVRHRDGGIRRLHQQWVVKNGDDGQPARMIGIMVDDTEAWRLAQAHDAQQVQLALDEALTGVARWRHDLRTDRLYYDEAAYRLNGIAPRADGVPLAQAQGLVHPDDLPRVMAATAQAMRSGEPVDVEARIRRPDGGWRHLLMRRVVQRDAAGEAVALLGVAFDISQRVRAQRQALEFSRRLDLATRSAGIGHWNIEAAGGRTHWSDQMRVLHGLAGNAPIPDFSTWLATFVHPADRELVSQTYRRWDWKHSDPGPMRAELRILRSDGSLRHVLTHSHVERQDGEAVLFGIAIDITERHLSNLALRNADEHAALAARGAGVGTWELDLRDGHLRWDPQMWLLRGRQPRPSAPHIDDALAMLHPDDRPELIRQFDLANHSPRIVERDFRVVWPGGQVRWLASRSAPVLDDDGRLVRRLGINWDVTDARRAQTERRERDLAEAANRAKNEFLSRMSHELRTPLNAVLGFAQLLQADLPVAENEAALARKRVDHILVAGQHLAVLIDDMLDLAAIEGGRLKFARQAVAMTELVAQTLPLIEPLRGERSLPPVRVDALTGIALGDPTRLRQALLKLLTHAVKYNRPGGQVTVAAEVEGEQVVLSVRDNGLGLSAEQLAHLFDPFNRLDAEAGGADGTGIGLAMAKSLVEGMGGELRARNTPDQGSVFEMRLPLDRTPLPAPPTRRVARPHDAAAADAGPGGVVLYVEDNPVNALVVREMLALRGGMTLHVAGDGATGVRMARELRPDLVLLDMQLPDFDGYEVLRRLRADPVTADIPCVALSAGAMPQDMQRARDSGLTDYWTKPLDLDDFMRGLDRLFSADTPPRGG